MATKITHERYGEGKPIPLCDIEPGDWFRGKQKLLQVIKHGAKKMTSVRMFGETKDTTQLGGWNLVEPVDVEIVVRPRVAGD